MKTLDEMIAVMQAARDGLKVQKFPLGFDPDWKDDPKPNWDWSMWDFRIKPEPKRVPLGPDDVPPGSVIRKGSPFWCSVMRVFSDGLGIMFYAKEHPPAVSYKELADAWEISRDGGKTWQPCWKEVA